jgi:hypothetical protein
LTLATCERLIKKTDQPIPGRFSNVARLAKALQTIFGKGKLTLWANGLMALNRKPSSFSILALAKTIIGLLIAQSYLNQGIRNVVYACGTIDLVHQTAREAQRLGIGVTCRITRHFDNDLFNQGKSICITTYSAVLNGRTVFKGQLRPGAIIFDDAHVANRLIRETFTLTIERESKENLYNDLVELFRPIFDEVGQKMEFQALIRKNSDSPPLLVPPCGFFDISDKVTSVVDPAISDQDAPLYFPWLYLSDHLKQCACFIDPESNLPRHFFPHLPSTPLQATFGESISRLRLLQRLILQECLGVPLSK